MLYFNTDYQRGSNIPRNDNNLIDLVFRSPLDISPSCDTLTIVTGFVGANTCNELKRLDFGKINVFIGYNTVNGFPATKHNKLLKIQEESPNINFFYCSQRIHSKIYMWSNDISHHEYAIGSANFSQSLYESLEETLLLNREVSDRLIEYVSRVKNISFKIESIIPKNDIYDYSDDLTFLSKKSSPNENIIGIKTARGDLAAAAGLNWGYSMALPGIMDAYIPIHVDFIRGNESIIPLKKTQNVPFDVVWDDNEDMTLLFEGNVDVNISGVVKTFPKQIGSFGDKADLGKYLRKRISNKVGRNFVFTDEEDSYITEFKKYIQSSGNKCTLSHYPHRDDRLNSSIEAKFIDSDVMKEYGRTDILISKSDDDVTYKLDFSVD